MVGLERSQTNSILGAGARGVSQDNLNLEALKFWQRFVLPNHSQKLFQNMQLGIMDIQYITTLKWWWGGGGVILCLTTVNVPIFPNVFVNFSTFLY